MTETMSSNPCRICMGSKMNQISIFINDLSRKLTEIADVEVQEGDGLPPTICEDCELDLEKCFKFREQIQWADSKFRESLSVSEVVFEECQIKQEVGPMHTFMNDDNQDQIEDDDDDRGPSDNDEDYEMRDDPEDKTENAEKERNQVTHPLDHVEIIEHRTKQEIHIASTDQNSQEEPLIVAQNMKSENEPTSDPLMHTEPQSMDTDNNMPGPSTSASTVFGSEHPFRFPITASPINNLLQGSGLPYSNPPLKQGPTTSLTPRLPFQITLPVGPSTQNRSQSFGSRAPLLLLTGIGAQKPNLNSGPNLPIRITSPYQNIRSLSSNSGIRLPFQVTLPGQSARPFASNQSSNVPFKITLPSVQKPHMNVAPGSQASVSGQKSGNSTANIRPRLPLIILLPNKALLNSGIRLSVPPPLHMLTNTRPQASVAAVQSANIGRSVEEPPMKSDKNFISNSLPLNSVDDKDSGKKNSPMLQNNRPFSSKFYKPTRIKKGRKPNVTCPANSKRTTLAKKSDRKLFKTHNETTCFVCNKSFVDNDMLLDHLKETGFYCRNCTKEFNCHSGLSEHFTTHIGHKCTTCKELFFCRKDLLQHFRTNDLCNRAWEKVKCDVCGKSYLNIKLLRNHQKEKHGTGQKRFQCIVCKDAFHEHNKFKTHLQIVHNAYEYISCKLCDKFFLGPVKLKNHMKHSHLKVRDAQYKCPTCKQAYVKESSLIRHLLVHQQNQNGNLCEQCGENIPGDRIKMARHIYYKHNDPSKRNYSCRRCVKTFDSTSDLKKHREEHHPRQNVSTCCEICGKQFKNIFTLRKHYKIHSEERSYKCDECGATFKQSAALYMHARTHSSQHKYNCDTCDKSFRWKQTFDKHAAKCAGATQTGGSDSD